MTTTTQVSSKGQVIIPKTLRDARRWGPGTRLLVEETPEGILLRRLAPAGKQPLAEGLAELRRQANHAGPAVSLEAMDAAVQSEAKRRR